jgi:hypothetical protein
VKPAAAQVRVRYARSYHSSPLTIERMCKQAPELSPLLLEGFQASSFPISSADFHKVMELLGEELDDLSLVAESAPSTPETLAELEKKYLNASPEVKQRVSRTIERGPIGKLVKRANGFRCQLCWLAFAVDADDLCRRRIGRAAAHQGDGEHELNQTVQQHLIYLVT